MANKRPDMRQIVAQITVSFSIRNCIAGETFSDCHATPEKVNFFSQFLNRNLLCIDFSEDDNGSERGMIAHMEHIYLFTI